MFIIGSVPDSVFEYMKWYVLALLIFSFLLTIGLSTYISSDLEITAPTLTTLPEATEGDWAAAIVNIFNYIAFFFENIGFLFSLVITNPFSAWAFISWIFTGATIMFVICILIVLSNFL